MEQKGIVTYTSCQRRSLFRHLRRALCAAVLCVVSAAVPAQATPLIVEYEFTSDPRNGSTFGFVAGAFEEAIVHPTGILNATLAVDEFGNGTLTYSANFSAELFSTADGSVLDTGFVNVSGQFNNVVAFDPATGLADPNSPAQQNSFAALDAGTHQFASDIDFLVVNGFAATTLSFVSANIADPPFGPVFGPTLVLRDDRLLGWFNSGFGRGDVNLQLTGSTATEIPEPVSMLLLGCGLLGAGAVKRKKS